MCKCGLVFKKVIMDNYIYEELLKITKKLENDISMLVSKCDNRSQWTHNKIIKKLLSNFV